MKGTETDANNTGLPSRSAMGTRIMRDQALSIGFMGGLRTGKSTLINALLGAEIVPSDIVPTTAVPTRIRWDTAPRAAVNFKDGTRKEVAVDALEHYITRTTEDNRQMACTVEDAELYYPCPLCRNGVQLIDTPSLNIDERMTEIAEKILSTLDVLILVMSAKFLCARVKMTLSGRRSYAAMWVT